jgi:hypothetical protein
VTKRYRPKHGPQSLDQAFDQSRSARSPGCVPYRTPARADRGTGTRQPQDRSCCATPGSFRNDASCVHRPCGKASRIAVEHGLGKREPHLRPGRICAGDPADAERLGHRHQACDSRQDPQSNSEATRRSSRKLDPPGGRAPEIGEPQSDDKVSGDSAKLFGEHPEVERRPAPQANGCHFPLPHAGSLSSRSAQIRPSLDVPHPKISVAPAKGTPTRVQLGAGPSHMPMPAEPIIHIRAKPPDGLAAKLPLLRTSTDKRESGENPTMAPRQAGDVVRRQDFIPSRESFIDPAGKRYVDGCDRRQADRPQPRVFDAHGD